MKQQSYIKTREGIGSLFHEMNMENFTLKKFDIRFDYELFYTGRQAFKYILDKIQSQTPTLLKKYRQYIKCLDNEEIRNS